MALTTEERINQLKDQLLLRSLTEPEIKRIKDKIQFLEEQRRPR
jgi:hypothetical protein